LLVVKGIAGRQGYCRSSRVLQVVKGIAGRQGYCRLSRVLQFILRTYGLNSMAWTIACRHSYNFFGSAQLAQLQHLWLGINNYAQLPSEALSRGLAALHSLRSLRLLYLSAENFIELSAASALMQLHV
jgi:hypothetical protein